MDDETDERTATVSPSLEALRSEIDRIDEELVELLHARARLVRRMAPLKHSRGLPMRDPGREEEILRRLAERPGPFSVEVLRDVFRLILEHCREEQLAAGLRDVDEPSDG